MTVYKLIIIVIIVGNTSIGSDNKMSAEQQKNAVIMELSAYFSVVQV